MIKYEVYSVFGTLYRAKPNHVVEYYNAFSGEWRPSVLTQHQIVRAPRCILVARNAVFKKG